MITINQISALRNFVLSSKQAKKTLGFVPTMGHLHQAHLDLVKLAQNTADHVIVSIYVNPLQFGENEDLDSYPRTLEDDLAKLKNLNVTAVFIPDDQTMYCNGKNQSTHVLVPFLGDEHCGKSRPQFFPGISTVVTKLFNLVQPDFAIFGEKDYQQLAIIKKMVADLFLPITILSIPITREPDGLAMSSRNSYLTTEQRIKAPFLFKTLQQAKQKIERGLNISHVIQSAKNELKENGFEVDYFNLCDTDNLEPINQTRSNMVILAATYLGKTRLIDNLTIHLPETLN